MKSANQPFAKPTAAQRDQASRFWVDSDLDMLSSHLEVCARERGRLFGLQCGMEQLQALASPRIVTSAALCALCLATSLVVLL